MYLGLFLAGGLVISRMEGQPILDSLFETASAIGTVGLSLGLTPQLQTVSQPDFDRPDVLWPGRRADADLRCPVPSTQNSSGPDVPAGADHSRVNL